MNTKYNLFYIPLAIISIIVLILHKVGPLEGKLRLIGLALFILLCGSLIVFNRDSKGKVFGAIIYLVLGLVVFL